MTNEAFLQHPHLGPREEEASREVAFPHGDGLSYPVSQPPKLDVSPAEAFDRACVAYHAALMQIVLDDIGRVLAPKQAAKVAVDFIDSVTR
jgi:hypothetical protein